MKVIDADRMAKAYKQLEAVENAERTQQLLPLNVDRLRVIK